jgi:hypothetical protein
MIYFFSSYKIVYHYFNSYRPNNNYCKHLNIMIRTVAELQTAQYLDCKPRQQVNNLVTISQCEEKDFIEKQTDCALVGILIQIRHNSFTNDERRQLVTTGSRYASGMNSGQRQRLGGGNRNYDRLALFADTRGNGRCFAIIFKNSTASTIFFRRCIRTQEGVGNIFFLDEPTAVISTIGINSFCAYY